MTENQSQSLYPESYDIISLAGLLAHPVSEGLPIYIYQTVAGVISEIKLWIYSCGYSSGISRKIITEAPDSLLISIMISINNRNTKNNHEDKTNFVLLNLN